MEKSKCHVPCGLLLFGLSYIASIKRIRIVHMPKERDSAFIICEIIFSGKSSPLPAHKNQSSVNTHDLVWHFVAHAAYCCKPITFCCAKSKTLSSIGEQSRSKTRTSLKIAELEAGGFSSKYTGYVQPSRNIYWNLWCVTKLQWIKMNTSGSNW